MLAVCRSSNFPAAALQPVADSFSKAAHSYNSAARLQRQVAYAAFAELQRCRAAGKKQSLGHLLDLGCGPGWLHAELLTQTTQLTAIDLSAGMLAQAASQGLPINYMLADAQALPLGDATVDTVFSSLMLQWCPAPLQVFSEIARVLKPGGSAVITTLVEGTLSELAQAFAAVDHFAHVHPFLTTAKVQQALQQTSNKQLVWHCHAHCYQLTYPDIFALARELKALGANHLASRARAGLTGKGYWQQVAAAYRGHTSDGDLLASYQVVQFVIHKT